MLGRWKDLKLALDVGPTVAFYQIGLAILPFATLARMSLRAGTGRTSDVRPSPDRLAKAVSTASSLLPWKSTCLGRSLATTALLRRHAFAASLKLGVARDETNDIAAHAWVEVDGTVLRDDDAVRYEPLPDVESLIR